MELAYKSSSVFDIYSFHVICMDHENFHKRQKRIVLNKVTDVKRAMAKNYYTLPRGVMQFGTQLLTYRRKMLPLSSSIIEWT
jgi:hypothetical protein